MHGHMNVKLLQLVTSLHLEHEAVAVLIAVWPFLSLPSHVSVCNFAVLLVPPPLTEGSRRENCLMEAAPGDT
jgi:hypothetical protein